MSTPKSNISVDLGALVIFLRYKIATFTRTDTGSWKAIIRRKGWPIVSKTFRIKRDAQDWARIAEDEIIRGVYIARSDSENFTVSEVLDGYLAEALQPKCGPLGAVIKLKPSNSNHNLANIASPFSMPTKLLSLEITV